MLRLIIISIVLSLSNSIYQNGEETLQFSNTFSAEYNAEVHLGQRVMYGSGFMASYRTSKRVEVTAITTNQGSVTIGRLQLYNSTPPMDYFHIKFSNGTQDCKARQSNRSSLYPFWYWTEKANKIGTMNINANTYDVWCLETRGVDLSVGILSGGDTSQPALYIEQRRNSTEQYYFFTLYQSIISNEHLFDVPDVCAGLKGSESVSVHSWEGLAF